MKIHCIIFEVIFLIQHQLKVFLNDSKTKYILFARNPLPPQARLSAINMGQDKIARVGQNCEETSVRFLGILIDDSFSFTSHTGKLCKNLSSALYALNISRLNSPLRIRKLLYHSLFESHLRFGAAAYGSASLKELEKILEL